MRSLRRRPPPTDPAELVDRSVRRYRRRHRRYERLHPEIFNPREQARLHAALAQAAGEIAPGGRRPPLALDLGCGTGNVTRHLLELGLDVLAADVSPEFLRAVERRHAATGRLRTLRVNGLDLDGIADASVDMACVYSVLHHIPDYAAALAELCRVVRPGGIVYVDHEAGEHFYDADGCFCRMLGEMPQPARLRRAAAGAATRLRQIVNPAYPWDVEGDIHVWEFARIEWPVVEERLERGGCTILRSQEYLSYSAAYAEEVWRRYEGRCTDMRLVVAQRH